MTPPVVCDWCDRDAAVTHPRLGNLCRACLTGVAADSDDDGDEHYQLRHEPFLQVCFRAAGAAYALEHLARHLAANAPDGKAARAYRQIIGDAIHDGTAHLLIEQGLCVPLGGDENVQLTLCYCDDPLETL